MEHLSAFLPMEHRQALARGATLPARGHGSALFADISGFTPLAEALVRSFGAQRGAEEMNVHLNAIWGALIAHVDRFAGSVIGFSGDAITCWFEADDGAAAAACGLAMQAGLRSLASIAIPREEPISISVKVAIAVGPVERYVVGDPAIQRFAVAVGPTMARMAAIEGVAARGEVLLDDVAAARLGDRIRIGDRRVGADGQGCVVVTAIDPPAVTPWPTIDEAALPAAELRTWVLPAVRERIGGSAAGLQAELRPVVALLLRFSGVLGDDPATRLAAWIAWVQRTLVARGGTLVDITFGDKGSYLLAVFGTPIAHEDDAVRAAAAALDLRDGAAAAGGQVDGVGVSSGRMCTGVFGGPTRRAFGVQGLDVTVAARLMQAAGPGRIVVSDRVARAVGRRFALTALGAISVKGISTPVDVHELVAPADVDPMPPGGQRAPLPIVGRDAELSVLQDGLSAVAGGERRSALVIAEAGAGKTRLVDEVADLARSDGFEVLRGTGDTLAQAVPYAVWRPIIGTVLGLDRPDGTGTLRSGAPPSADEVIARLSACLRDDDPDRFALLDPVLPVAILESAATAAMIPEARQDGTLDLLARLLEAGRGERPRLLAIDDAQWLDASSLALLDRVIRWAPRTLTIVAARRGEAESEMRALTDGAPVIELTHLGRDAARSLVAGALGLRDLPDAVARFIDERAEGHPFFSLEIGFALRDAGLLEIVDGSARVRGIADLATVEFPETIEGVIGVRLDRLRPDAQGLLKVCSVLGGSFTPDVLAEVDPVHAPGEVRRILDELEAVDLVVGGSRARTDASPYEFRHVLIRSAVYQRLLYAQRRELHTRAAHHFDRIGSITGVVPHGILAHHWEAAADPGRAIEHLDAAGSDALRDGAFREAADFLDRACAIAAGRSGGAAGDAVGEPVAVEPERLATWEWQSAQAHYRLGDLDESRALAEAALRVLDRPAPVGGPGLALGAGGQVVTQFLHRLLPRRYLDRAPGPERERLRRAVRAHFNLAEVYYLASLPGRSAYAALRGLNLAEWAGPSHELVEAYGAITIISGLLGRHGLADRYARLGLATAALVQEPAARAIILHQSSLYRSGVGPGARVLADFEEAFELFRAIGDKGRFRDALGLAGIAAHLYGRPALAERYLDELRAGIGDRERSLAGVWSTIWLGATALRRGDLGRAVRELERAVTMQVETADATTVAAHGLLASAYLAAERPAEALAEADRTRALIAATGGRASMHAVYDGYVALAQVSLAALTTAPDAAGRIAWRARCREASTWLAAYARLFPVGRVAHGLAVGDLAFVSGDPEQARRAWVRALQTAEELDMRYEQAAAHARLAEVASVPQAARAEHTRAAAALAEIMGVPVPRPIGAGAAGAAA